jgi:hypothetical protein
MKLPVQASPVVRGGYARAYQANVVNQSGCNPFKCGAKVIECAGQCIPNPFNAGCISCLGSAWDDCKSCF